MEVSMKRNIKIVLISATLMLFLAAIVYASNVTTQESTPTTKVSQASITKSSELLTLLDSEPTNLQTRVKYDELQSKSLYEIENAKYYIDIDTNNKLVGIHAKSISTTKETSNSTYEEAQKFITTKYEELNLPEEYELNYLEKFDDLIWQANFEKNYNGIYNKYESVKVFFIPDSKEIISLGAFYEAPQTTENKINETSAIEAASKNNNSEVVSAELSMEKASDNTIHSTWVITYSDNEIIYVDAASNQIIGGDTINE